MTRVAIVDDDDLTRQALPLLLGPAGYEVLTFADGGAALAFLLDDPGADLVVVLDLQMVPVGGLAVLEALAERRPALIPRVIVLSGSNRTATADQLRPYPVARLLLKPLRSDVLREVVAAVAEGLTGAA
ncbi:MAG: response regulator [Chloroflexi bacterium]|nr:response regulator [Chloroflexota bacterium]MBU1750412.1 response regulator [Chloroflexota bacterium]